MGVCDSFNCSSGVPTVAIPACGDVDYGQAIVKIFIARLDSTGFNDETDFSSETTWNTKLGYSATGSSYVERIVAIGDLYNGLKPATEDETEPAPYGGDELISRKHTVTFEIKRFNRQLFDSINQLRCRNQYKMWFLTNKGYCFGDWEGYNNVSINWGSMELSGIGNGKSKSSNTMTWTAIDDSEPIYLPFLATKTN